MSKLVRDQDVVNNGRQKALPEQLDDGTEVVVPLRDQLSKRLVQKLEDLGAAEKIVGVWTRGNTDRAEWLTRQDEYLMQYDEFIKPIYESSTDWGSTLHLPTMLTIVKTFHARMFSAIMGQDPPFSLKSRTAANVDRAPLVEQLMRYTILDWANEHMGIKAEIDKWVWSWCAAGTGIIKTRWERKFTRFEDVVERQIPVTSLRVDPQTGQSQVVQGVRTEEELAIREIETFNGPVIENMHIEDVLIVGGEGDPQKADHVIQQMWLTASDLWAYADQGIFRKEVVEEVIKGGDNPKVTDITGNIKQSRSRQAGENTPDKEFDLDRYKVLEAYVRMDVDGSGINSDLIVWIHATSRKILRATYLYRVMPTGLRPFHKIDFHRRHGVEYSVGLIEMLYSLSREIDAMHNMRVDVGILTSLPWGFYQPSAGTPEEKLEIEPGALIPVENPTSNVFFPNLGNRTSFGYQEEESLMQQVQRLTSMSDMSYGVIGGQGATRTATGTRAIMGEANANLDIYLQRLNLGWKRALTYLFHMLQERLPAGFQFRILGDDGNNYWAQIEDRKQLQGMYDFELDGNSSNSNPTLRFQSANQVLQLVQNPLLLQLGIVSPLELYNANKDIMTIMGIKDVSKFLRKPGQPVRMFTPMEIANRLLTGIDVPLDPTQDLAGFVEFVNHIMSEDELLGQFGQGEISALVGKMREAQNMLQALQAQQSQQSNMQQQQVNQQASQLPGDMSVSVSAPQNTLLGKI